MSIKLAPPRPAKTPYYSGRGTYFGIYVDRSTKDRQRPLAIKVIRQWEREIEDGNFVGPDNPTFASASLSYMRSGGERKFLTPLLKYFGETPLKQITQALIDRAAAELLPNGTAPTLQPANLYACVRCATSCGQHDASATPERLAR